MYVFYRYRTRSDKTLLCAEWRDDPRLKESESHTTAKYLILYDGVCVLCNNSVQFLLEHDTEEILHFAPLQGSTAADVLQRNSIGTEYREGIVYVRDWQSLDEALYHKSDAVLMALYDIGGPLGLLSWLIYVPRFLRDFLYDIVAENRYEWFGQYDQCKIPDSDQTDRFLD